LVIRTLDAIHLVTAHEWLEAGAPDTLELWTLDRQFNLCAAVMSIRTPLLE